MSNTKLLQLADSTNGMEANRITDHFLEKLKVPTYEWKRISKALNAIEFLIKYGSINIIGKVQM